MLQGGRNCGQNFSVKVNQSGGFPNVSILFRVVNVFLSKSLAQERNQGGRVLSTRTAVTHQGLDFIVSAKFELRD